jgi:hypothetical protein
MPYTKKTWVDGSTKLGPTNLNPIENALASAYTTYNVKDTAYGAVGDGVANDTAAIQAAATAATGGSVLHFPPGDYKITSPILVPPGVSVVGAGISTNLRPNGCDGLHLVGPINFIGPYTIRDLAIQGTSCTNFAGIRVDGGLVSGDSVQGYVISNLYIQGFGYGMYLRNLWRSSIYGVRMFNVYYGIYLKGQNVLLNFDGCVVEKNTPPGTPAGATNSTGFYCNAAADYNPGGNTNLRPESIRVSNSQFYGFEIGVDHQQCLVAHYEGLDLDASTVYGIRYNQSSGGLTLQGDWIAMTGAAAIAGIYAQDVGICVSTSAVVIDGFHITNYTAHAGSVGIKIGDRQNNVAIRSCYIGPDQGGSDFQTADIQVTGVANAATGHSITDTVCGSTTPTNSLSVGNGGGAISGRATNLTLAKGLSVQALSVGKFVVDPGKEIGYDQITAGMNVTGTTANTGDTLIAGTQYAFDGLPVVCELFIPEVVTPNNAGAWISFDLWEGATLIAALGTALTPAGANMRVPVAAQFRFTPTAGNHTYTIKMWAANTVGTPQVVAGNGTGGADVPAYVRFVKA